MSHAYAGNPVYPGTITIPDDGDIDAAASYAVAFEQLADRCAALTGGGVGGSFLNPILTNATFHGLTTFLDGPADGAITASVAGIDFEAGTFIEMTALDTVYFASGAAFTIESSAQLVLSASSFVQLMGGIVEVSSSLVSIGAPTAALTLYANDVSISADTILIEKDGPTAITIANSVTITSSGELYQSGFTSLEGVVCYKSQNRTAGDGSAIGGNTTFFEYILPIPGLITSIALDSAGAQLGQRVRFNAQKNTSLNHWNITTGGHTWQLRNATGYTVAVEFVCDGSAWIVDEWEEGGKAIRNA